MVTKTTIFNPFTGRDPNEVWRELYKIAIPADKETAMKEIIKKINKNKKK